MKTPALLGPDGKTALRDYAGYHGGAGGFGGQLRAWNPPSESADAALLPNFSRGNARADDLVRNNGYAANAVQLHQDHIFGSFLRLSYLMRLTVSYVHRPPGTVIPRVFSAHSSRW